MHSRSAVAAGDRHTMPRLSAIPRIDNSLRHRQQVWTVNPSCCSCGLAIEQPLAGAIVPTAQGTRIAHIGDCHHAALDTHEHHVPIVVACGRLVRQPRLELVR